MQQLKLKQIEGIVTPTTAEEWDAAKDQLVTAEAIRLRIEEVASEAVSGAVTAVSATTESNKYISALAKNGNTITATKTALPVTGVTTTNTTDSGTTTKAVVSIALKSGKVVATEKAIAFPAIPHLATFVSEFAPEVSLPSPAYNEQSILVFVNGLMQNPAELGLAPDRISFKDPSHFNKADTLFIVYLTV